MFGSRHFWSTVEHSLLEKLNRELQQSVVSVQAPPKPTQQMPSWQLEPLPAPQQSLS